MKKEKKGVGKPTLYKKAMKRINVMLDEETIKFYTEQGKGNLSDGIRKHWRLSNTRINPTQQSEQRTDFRECGGCEYNPCDLANNADYCPARR